MVGDDLERDEDTDRRRTFRVSRIRGEITFATRRERDFRMPADFNVTAYRDRAPWRLVAEESGTATLNVTPTRAGWSSAASAPTASSRSRCRRLRPLHDRLLGDRAAARPGSSPSAAGRGASSRPTLRDAVVADLQTGRRRPQRPGADARREPQSRRPPPEPALQARGPSAVAPRALRPACWRCSRSCSRAAARARPRGSESAELEERFQLDPQELKESLELLNLVNFGGGCYAVYCSTDDGHVVVDKELYGDAFRRPARLSPLEAKALLRALDVVAPLVAAEADTSLQTVREKVEAAFGRFPLTDTPMPQEEGAEEHAVTILNEGVRSRLLVEITYLSRSSDELSTRTIEPYLLRRDDKGWYVEAYDRTRGGRRTFKVAYIKDADLIDEPYEPRADMADLDHSLGGDVGVARVWFSAGRARWELEGRPGTRPLEDGSAVAEVTYGSRAWLISEILRYRGQAEVLEPATVRQEVAEAATALLDEFTAVAAG